MKNIDLPIPFKDIMITYKKTIYFGAYRNQTKVETVTKRGFYSDLFNNFAIPPEYQYFNGALLPHGFNGIHVNVKNVISWEYCKD